MAQPRLADTAREPEPVLVREGVTVEEYLAMPETTTPHNLIKGRLYTSPTPIVKHQDIVAELFAHLRTFSHEDGGHAFLSPMDCHLPDRSVVQPDVGYITSTRLGIIDRWVMGAPDIAIEVLSPGTRRFDRVKKLRTYEKNGVREVWLVDPDSQTVILFFNAGTACEREQSVLFGDPIPSTIAPLGTGGLEQFA